MKRNINKIKNIITILFFITISCIGLYISPKQEKSKEEKITSNNNTISYEISNIPEYSGNIYIEINNNNPKFSNENFNIEEDYYSELENGRVRHSNDKN